MAEPELVTEIFSESELDIESQSESESEANLSFLDSPTFKESSIRVLEALPTDTDRLQLSRFFLKYDKLLTNYKETTTKCHNVLIDRISDTFGNTSGLTAEELTSISSIYHSFQKYQIVWAKEKAVINSELGQKLRQEITVEVYGTKLLKNEHRTKLKAARDKLIRQCFLACKRAKPNDENDQRLNEAFKQYDKSLETEEASFFFQTDKLVKEFIETSEFTSVIFMSKLFEFILNGLTYIVKF